jgi:hypothetical protein
MIQSFSALINTYPLKSFILTTRHVQIYLAFLVENLCLPGFSRYNLPSNSTGDKQTGAFLMYIYLDESGDLGFDFSKTKTTKKFVITLLVCDTPMAPAIFKKAVHRTLRNKRKVTTKCIFTGLWG